jgi:YbbR domain-containing protein
MDKWLRNVNVVRIIALVLGVVLWIAVEMDEQTAPGTQTPVIRTQEISNVSITQIGLDESQYSLKSVQPSEVTVRMRGKQSALSRVNTKNTQIQLDLSAISKGTHSLRLKDSGFPSGVEVEIYPQNVTVTVEERQKKEVRVDIIVKGTPAEGFKAGLPIVEPSRVHVTASTSSLEQIEFVRAEIDVEGANANVSKEVKLLAYDKQGKEVQMTITPSVVNVEVPITSPFKTMPLQIRLIGQTPPGFSVASYKQSVNQVTIYGPQSVLDQLEFYDGLEINLSQLTADHVFSTDLRPKQGIEQIVPKRVEVEIDIVPSETRTFEQVDIAINGANQEYDTTIVEPLNGKIDLTLEAAPAILAEMGVEDIQALVDVSNLSAGRYERPLVLNLPAYVKRGAPQDILIAVEIAEKAAGAIEQDVTSADQAPAEN